MYTYTVIFETRTRAGRPTTIAVLYSILFTELVTSVRLYYYSDVDSSERSLDILYSMGGRHRALQRLRIEEGCVMMVVVVHIKPQWGLIQHKSPLTGRHILVDEPTAVCQSDSLTGLPDQLIESPTE